MFVDDQDEDFEEEEEFHEVEEEKHKTSQESVGSSGQSPPVSADPSTSPTCLKTKNSNEINCDEGRTTKSSLEGEQNELRNQQQQQPSPPLAVASISAVTEAAQIAETEASSQPRTNDLGVSKIIDEGTSTENKLASVAAPSTIFSDIKSDAISRGCGVREIRRPASQEPAKTVDWANIMLNNNDQTRCGSSQTLNTSNSSGHKNTADHSPVNELNARELDDIVKATECKLRIVDEPVTGADGTKVQGQLETHEEIDSYGAKTAEKSDSWSNAHEASSKDSFETEPAGLSKQTMDGKGVEKSDDVEEKKLDLDEDVKNPQYIPKKGVFYEHDDRSHDADDIKQSSNSSKKEEEFVRDSSSNKKPIIQEKTIENRRGSRRQRTDADRWNHDLFRDEKQKPKSKSELINVHGYDIRQERSARNQTENRNRGNNNNTNFEKTQGSQENQRSRPTKDSGVARQSHQMNRSRDRKQPRRPNIRNDRGQRNDQGAVAKRDGLGHRQIRQDIKDIKEPVSDKQTPSAPQSNRRDQESTMRDGKNIRNDSRSGRKTSRDRPANSNDEKTIANAVMPPITTWSSEDMAKAEAFNKESPSRQQQNAPNTTQRNRQTEYWQQNQLNKGMQHDRSIRNSEDTRHHQHYNSRPRYQDRNDDSLKQGSYLPRNQYSDRSNHQNQDWHRSNNFSPYAKSNDYVVKTQTFENSRLSQNNMNRSRDLRDLINERRMQSQQNFHTKPQLDHIMHTRGQVQGQQPHQFVQTRHHQQQQQHHQHSIHHHHQQQHPTQQLPQHALHQHHLHHQQQQSAQLQQPQQQQQQQHHQQQQQPAQTSQQPLIQPAHQQQQSTPQSKLESQTQSQLQQQPTSQAPQQPLQNNRQQSQAMTHQSRQNIVMSNLTENNQESARLSTTVASSNDLLSSRPIIKTDTYSAANITPHQQTMQPLPQPSQSHRSIAGQQQLAQQGHTNPNGSHLMPSHLGTSGTQAQYYAPSSNSRDPVGAAAAAALATAYHGYIPGGHSVMDTARYHMASQQLSDHGYMTTPGQTNDVATGPVMHQQGMYTDAASAGGTVASSAYLAQAGSTLSPNANIPVTGAGPPPLAPVSYLQHSQYPPPPYSNPYPQPQPNQAPPQSSHYPYWTYI